MLSSLALLTRQSMIVAYMILGLMLGPYGFGLVSATYVVKNIGEMGIIFLLFLLGLDLQPQKLVHTFRKISLVGIVSSVIFFSIGYLIGYLLGYTHIESFVFGVSLMFSSTIIGIKLLPTSVLHHQHTGEMMISVLLLQDILAILILTLLHAMALASPLSQELIYVIVAFPGFIIFAYLFEHFCLMPLLIKFSRIKEYIFLLSIAWCLSMSELAELLKLSAEMGAFIAGVSIAISPISIYIARPYR